MLLTLSGNMCSIFGSTKLEDIRKLLELNKSRGGYSWSFAAFEYWDGELRLPALYKAIGSFPLDLFDDPPVGDYYLGHIQIPTGGNHGLERVHPAVMGGGKIKDRYLWHNGLLHSGWMNSSEERKGKWDTQVILSRIAEMGFIVGLHNLPGSYGCALYDIDRSLYFFRNKHAQLHYGENLQISSVEFPGSKLLPDSTIVELDYLSREFRVAFTLPRETEEDPLYHINK